MPIRLSTTALAAAAIISAGCGSNRNATHDSSAGTDSATHASTANGAVVPASDTTRGALSANIDALGPGIQVSPTDEHNVTRALDYKLTNDDWMRFLQAADSVAALRGRDAQVRAYLDAQIVGAKTDDAGQKWLESNPKVSAAITSAGMTVKDYYRMGIVTAYAMRFMNNPKAAPPTPAGRANAQFLRDHQSELEHLRTITQGTLSIRATPSSP